MFLVSVIVPVYNSQKYLKQCIESILNQTYQKIEVILVNDGSTDCSLEVCELYKEKDNRIVVVDKENKGVSSARNVGLDLAKGSYIAFVDSDDELYPNAIEVLLDDLIFYSADIASGLKERILLTDKKKDKFEVHNNSVAKIYEGISVLNLAIEGISQSACARLIKKSVVEHIRFVEGKCVNEDGFFMFQCYLQLPKVVERNTSVYKYYAREASVSRGSFSEKYFDILYFLERKKELVRELFPNCVYMLPNLEVRTHLRFLQVLCRTTERRYKKQQKESIQIVKAHYRGFDFKDKHERRVAWIVAHGLYPLYKCLVRIKYYW